MPLRAHLLLLHARHDALLAPEVYGESHHTSRGERKTAYALQELAAEQRVPTEVDISNDALPTAVREAMQHRYPLLLVLCRPDPVLTAADLVTDTAIRLLRDVPYPLLLVPRPGWYAFPPRHLLLVVDGQPFSLRPNQDLLRCLLAATQGTLDVVHVVGEGETMPGPEILLGTARELLLTENLSQTMGRVMPFWTEQSMRPIRGNQPALVGAHGNSLRALLQYIDHLTDTEVPQLNIPGHVAGG